MGEEGHSSAAASVSQDYDGVSDGEQMVALVQAESDIAELEGRLRWALADLENLKKRFEREVERQRREERAFVVAEWLPVVDNLELALEHAGANASALVEGVRAVRDQAVSALGRLGYSRYEDTGARFDPTRHEALGTVVDEGRPGTVFATIRPGYASADAVLRPAGVIVSRGQD